MYVPLCSETKSKFYGTVRRKHMSKLFLDQDQYALRTGQPLIQVEHLSRVIETRAQKTTILHDLTFSVPVHSLFAINGPSATGKSTVLNILTGIHRPTNGPIIFPAQE